MDNQFKRNLIISIIAFSAFIGFFIYYQKWNATWFGINILLWSLIAVGIAYIAAIFSEKAFLSWPGTYRLSSKFFIAFNIGTLLFILAGSQLTEPKEFIYEEAHPEKKEVAQASGSTTIVNNHYYYGSRYNDRYRYSRSGRSYNSGWISDLLEGISFESSSESSSDSGSGDSEDLGELVFFIGLIVLILILIIGSCFISHFWVLSCIFMITLTIYWLRNNYVYLKA